MPELVYISSTFQDLKPFRQAIIKCVTSLVDYYKPVSMEFYEAEDIHFVKRCLDDVEACNIYILILGKRYGYIPKNFDRSITELEYQKALECKRNGKPIEILVFKVGDLCKDYNYEEQNEKFVEYQQGFLDEVNEFLSPKAFDSEIELQLQVSYALMKRLFKLISKGERIIMPDKDAVLCYCDRKPVFTSLKMYTLKQKRIFFIQGDRMKDYPGGIVKRFAKYSLGSFNKIEPVLQITSLTSSCDSENQNSSIICNILEYVNRPQTLDTIEMKGFVKELGLLKSNKVILPFYYDFNFDPDFDRFTGFLCFLDAVFEEYEQQLSEYGLYIIIILSTPKPDFSAVKPFIDKRPRLSKITAMVDKLSPVYRNDILDWLEAFVTRMEFSPEVYRQYFGEDDNRQYNMQDVNTKLNEIITDLTSGSEKIKKFL